MVDKVNVKPLLKEESIQNMLEEDIVKGLCTEKQYEVWVRVRKLNWSYKEAARFFEISENAVKDHITTINKNVKNFRVKCRQRGGNFFQLI